MSSNRISCAWSSDSTALGTQAQTTISSTSTKSIFIKLEETPINPPLRRSVYNPYKDEYVAKKKSQQKLLHQMRLQHGDGPHDSIWVGDTADQPKPGMIRFWIQNVNSLVQNNDYHTLQFELANLADKSINYFSLTETCINTNRPGCSQQIKNAFTQLLPNGQMKLANTPKYPTTTFYQPGGFAGGLDGSLRTRYLREGADECGRWAW